MKINKIKVNYLIDVIILLIFIIMALTGIIKFLFIYPIFGTKVKFQKQ